MDPLSFLIHSVEINSILEAKKKAVGIPESMLTRTSSLTDLLERVRIPARMTDKAYSSWSGCRGTSPRQRFSIADSTCKHYTHSLYRRSYFLPIAKAMQLTNWGSVRRYAADSLPVVELEPRH